MTNKKVHGKVKLPLSKAYLIALQSIKVRFGRSMVTALGIVLGIAFFTAVRTTQIMSESMPVLNEIEAQENAVRLTWLVIMSLLMCTVGIANSMLMSVTERYKEIGTMKCLGSTDIFIVEIFIFEAMLMGVIASAIGSVLGILLMLLVRIAGDGTNILAMLDTGKLLVLFFQALGIGAILTMIAAIAPAWRAAIMPAAAALRTEI